MTDFLCGVFGIAAIVAVIWFISAHPPSDPHAGHWRVTVHGSPPESYDAVWLNRGDGGVVYLHTSDGRRLSVSGTVTVEAITTAEQP